MSKFSNALHRVFGFVAAEAPDVEARAKVIRDKAEAEIESLRKDAVRASKSKAASDLRAAFSLVATAVSAHAATLEASPAPTPPVETPKA